MSSTLNHAQLRDAGGGQYTVTRIAGDADATTVGLYSELVVNEKGALNRLCRWLAEGRPYPQPGVNGGVVYRHKTTGWSYTFDPSTLNEYIAWAQGA